MQDLSKTTVSTRRQFADFRRKKEQKQNSRPFENTPWNTRPLNTTVLSDNYCASCKINSLEPKRSLKTQIFEEKGHLSGDKRFWPDFSRIIECNKPQGTIHKDPQGILTITVELMRAFF